MTQTSQDPKRKLNFKKGDTSLTLLFLASLGLAIWAVGIYRLTIIDMKYLIAVFAFGTIIAFAITFFWKKSSYSIFWIFIVSLAIGGGFTNASLLYLNHAFADKEFFTEEFQIIKTGNLASGRRSRCSKPYAVVAFHGTQKQLVFYCNYEKTIKNYSKALVTYSKGLFGFDVIKTTQLSP